MDPAALRAHSLRALPRPPRWLIRFSVVAALSGGGRPALAQETAISRPWAFDLITGLGYDDNIRFTPSMESALSGRLRAGLSRLMRSPRAQLSLGGSAEGSAYRHSPELNRINYTADATANYLISPRSAIRVGDTFAKGYTGESRLLLDAGLLFPRTVSTTNDASIEVSHQISPRWTWSASAQHRLVRFDSNALRDTSSFTARADLAWTSAPGGPVGLYYEFGHMTPRGQPSSDVHGATVRAARRLSEPLSISLELGARTLISQRTDSTRVVPTGSAGFSIRSGKQTIEANAARSVSEAFGLGRLQVRSVASLKYACVATSRLSLGLSTDVSRSQDPSGLTQLSFVTGTLGGNLRFRIARDADFSAGGGYRRLDPIATARTHSRFLSLAVRVGQTW
jgi:hypothetical protein